MARAKQAALGLASFWIGACGYPDFTFVAPPSADGGGSCNIIHDGGGTCEYLPGAACGCEGQDKCSVVDEATGRSQCTRAGPLVQFNKCGSDNDCAAGTWCDKVSSVCAKICQNIDDCDNGGQCIRAIMSMGAPIPGLKICTSHCEPISAAPCGENVSCVYRRDVTEFDCLGSEKVKEGVGCEFASDCDKGLVCATPSPMNPFNCARWCKPVGTSAPDNNCPFNANFCLAFGVLAEYEGTEYGICAHRPL
jgi:hypothetical protein